jgi:O-glycosyl hydrolase
MLSRRFLTVVFLATSVASQQIWDSWQTTWDRSSLFTNRSPSAPINFTAPGAIGDADIQISDSTLYQTMDGVGASLTDSSAQVLNNLKNKNSGNYWNLLNALFNVADGSQSAMINYLRLSIGASDFSQGLYSFDDTSGDTSLSKFNANAPSYFWTVLADIVSINKGIKIHILPWSPPGWMKSSGSMNGGSFNGNTQTYANYLLKSLQAFNSKGYNVYAISIQNEPENSNPTYPTALIGASAEAAIGNALRPLMNSNGFSGVKLVAYEHNWDHAASYPVQVMQQAGNSFDGAAFHCYAGNRGQQNDFHNAYPSKSVWFTECSGTNGSDWWSDIKWYMDNLFIGSVENWARGVLMWNIALDGNGNPKLPGTDSCGGSGCRGVVQVNSDGSYSFNQEYYSMAHLARGFMPRDAGGPIGQRIGVSLGGGQNWALRVAAFVTKRSNSADWNRYSIVVLNWHDTNNGQWSPTPVKATIEFRGQQATYTFPVGITTLWWYAQN